MSPVPSGASRSERLVARVTPREKTRVEETAASFGLTLSAFLRMRTIFGGPNGSGSVADDWWDRLPPARREQVYRWLNPGSNERVEVDGQQTLPDLPAEIAP